MMQKAMKYWQDELGLNDWIIDLRDNCPVSDFETEDAEGETSWNNVCKTAVIKLISLNEYGKRIIPYIKEQTLIHELLHIKFGVLWESNTDLQNALLHQYIEDLAKSLYEVHKEKGGKENVN